MIKKIFTLLLMFFPILGVYVSPIPGLDLATFCLLLLAPFLVVGALKSKKIHMPFYMSLLIFYTLFSSLFSYMVNSPSDIVLAVSRIGKFVVVLTMVFIIAKENYFDYVLAKKILKIVTMIAVSYIIVQSIVFYTTGQLLISYPSTFVRSDNYSQIDYSKAASVFFRPTSFFVEPAHFAQYVLVYLIYCLFGDYQEQQLQYKSAVFITVGIFLSTSGQGIGISLLAWGLWVFNKLSKSNIRKKFYIIILSLIFIATILPSIFETDIIKTSIGRVFTDTGSLGVASEGRLFSYDYFMELSPLEKIIGAGYGNIPENTYFNSLAYSLSCSGIIGVAIMGMLFYDAFRHTRYYHRYLCMFFALLIPGAAVFTATGIAFYFIIIYSGYDKKIPVKIKSSK